MSSLTTFGNGTGFIYRTFPGTTNMAMGALVNSRVNIRTVLKDLMASGPVISGTTAFFIIDITAVAAPGDILTVVANGVSLITSPIPGVVGDPVQTAIDVAAEINTTVSVPNYTAQASGGTVVVSFQTSGTTPNGYVVSVTADASITFTADATVEGGSDGIEAVSPVWGMDVWLNSSTAADEYVVSGTNITEDLVSFYFGRPQRIQNVTDDSAGAITVERDGVVSYIEVNSTGALAQIGQITAPYASPGDRLIIYGKQAANSIQIKDVSTPVGSLPNIYTDSAAVYNSEGAGETITLMYIDDATLGLNWFEISRSNAHPVTVADLAAASIPQGLPGNTAVTPVLGGTTFTLSPRTDKVNQTLTGGPYALTGNNNFVGGGTPLAGDSFTISGGGVVVTNAGGAILIQGDAVPARMAANGDWTATLLYNGSAWVCQGIYPNMGNGNAVIQDSQIYDVSGSKLTAASIVAGKYGAQSIDGGTDIMLGSVDFPQLSAGVQAAISGGSSGFTRFYIQVTIPSADILTLNTTPVQVIAAPGAGNYILVEHVSILTTFVTTAYAVNTQLNLKNDDPAYSDLATCPGALSFGSTKQFNMLISEGATDRFKPNSPIIAYTPTGDPTLGDGSIKLQIWYYVVAM